MPDIRHGAQCRYSSRQADWCQRCQVEWHANAHVRFFRGICILMGTIT